VTIEFPLTRIEPPQGGIQFPDVRAIWRYRDLLMVLIWRDLSARYRQSVVGYGWAFLKPALSIVIFAFVFGQLAGLPSDGIPYPLFALAALVPWNYFSTSLAGISASIVGGAGLFTKVYFPRLILPLASLGTGLAELGLQLLLMSGLMAWYGVRPGWQLLMLPGFIILAILTSFAFGLWLAVLNVRYRDIGHVVPFLLQAWMWVSPVVYSSQLVPERWRWAYSLNPMAGVIDGFRWSVLGTAAPDPLQILVSIGVVATTSVIALACFRRQESTFADVV
jgi:lipopolysaccharide transport system permease protein